jgi:hypothetical protein
MSEQDKGFTVKDRRRFDESGNERPDAEEAPRETAETKAAFQAAAPSGSLPAIDFVTFVLSLSTSAMVHLGEAPAPDGSSAKNLELARQTIDILGMLEDKTKGNLSNEEAKLLQQLLCDLRLRYVALSK